jgi:hypothetical protein
MNQAEIRAALAKRGLTTKHIEQIEVLSSGEKSQGQLVQNFKPRNEFINTKRSCQSIICRCTKRRIDACFKGISRKHLNGIPQT